MPPISPISVLITPTFKKVRAELTARIEQLNRGRSNTEAWVKALRHGLAQERAKREAAEDRLAIVTDRARVWMLEIALNATFLM